MRERRMKGDRITVTVDPDVAKAYRAASEQQRRKLDLLVSLCLRQATQSGTSLEQVMREISESARQRGLTPEALESLLDED